jgi:lipopolysaccharide heptosyltransferase I
MIWLLYNLALLVFSPVIAVWLLYRLVIRGKSRDGFAERFGHAPALPPPAAERVWIHAVSAGEVVAAAPVVRALRDLDPDLEIVVSTITPAGRSQAARLIPGALAVTYFPFDLLPCVRHAQDRVRPTRFVAVETELWPNFLREAKRRGIHTVIVNGRFSDRSMRRLTGWGSWIRPLYAVALGCVDRLAMQTPADVERAVALGAEHSRLSVCGNTKFDQEIATLPLTEADHLRRAFHLQPDQPLLLAGSTHPGEEELILAAWEEARRSVPDLALMIAPRHIDRADAVEPLCRAWVAERGDERDVLRRTRVVDPSPVAPPLGPVAGRGDPPPNGEGEPSDSTFASPLSVSGRGARGEGSTPDEAHGENLTPTPILILDTVGELAAFYGLAQVAFVGGSLAPIGGHDVLQPLFHGKPTFFGPHMHNQRDLAALATASGAAVQVQSADDLARELRSVLTDPERAASMAADASTLLAANRGASRRCAETILQASPTSHNELHIASQTSLEFPTCPATESPRRRTSCSSSPRLQSPGHQPPGHQPPGHQPPDTSSEGTPRILLVRLSAIGDVVVATPVIRALRQAMPSAHLAWLVEERAADIVRGNPDLDEVIIWPRASWAADSPGVWGLPKRVRQYFAFIAGLRRRRFDVAIDFQGLLRSGLVAFASGARRRITSEGTREGSRLFYTTCVPRTGDLSSRQRCLDLLQPLGIASRDRRMHVWFGDEDRQAADALLAEAEGKPIACLCPATTWRHKHWREERWRELADRLTRDLGLRCVFMGGRADLPMIGRIRDGLTVETVVAAGRTSLKQAAAILERARLVVSVDTALMHIGVAVGAPVVALCGPSYWPGFQDYDNFRMIRKPYPCSPCLRHPTCPADDCMTAITTAEVVAEARSLLEPSDRLLRVL